MTTILNLLEDPFFSDFFSSDLRMLKKIKPDQQTFESIFMDSSTTPRINIYYTKDKYVIEAACAGYKKEDIDIEIKDDEIILSYKNSDNVEQSDKTFLIKQISQSSFKKRIKIPNSVEKPKEARYENGTIVLEFLLKEESKPIKVKLIS